jgi:hypothetical protein
MVRASAPGRRGDAAGARFLAALGATLCAVAAPATAQRGLQSQSASVQLIVTVPATEERALRLPALGLGEQFQHAPRDTVLVDPRLGRVVIRMKQARGAREGLRTLQMVWQ